MSEGTTCYERDEVLCEDQMCLRVGCKMRNERLAHLSSGSKTAIVFWYKNYKGEQGYRRAVPISIRYGTSDYHRSPQWLMLAFDTEKEAEREFAMADMSHNVLGNQIVLRFGGAAQAAPVMWVCLVPGPAPAGAEMRIRAWTADRKRMESLRAEGLDMQPLYASPVSSTEGNSRG